MNKEKFLSENKETIIDEWFKFIINSYPNESGKFLIKKTEKITNPIGYMIAKGIEDVFDGLFIEKSELKVEAGLDELIKLRAVQEFSASQAIGFIFQLKSIVRMICKKTKSDVKDSVLLEVDSIVDDLILKAFDMFMSTRERLYEIKSNEVKLRTSKMIERLNNKYEYLDAKEL